MGNGQTQQGDPPSSREDEPGQRDCETCRNRYLAILSHELRNPLSALSNSLYVLKRSQPSEPRSARAMAVIERQIRRLASLVDNLSEAAAIGRGRIQLRCVRLDLRSFLQDTFSDHEAVFAGREVAFRSDLPAAPVPILADPVRLSQILGSLLENAGQFTPAGGKVSLALDADAAAHIARIRVEDSGVGLEAEVRERLFLPFSQADTSLARTAGGLGLGLALAKGLVDLHGGRIHVASAGLGRGTTFTVELPLAEEASSPLPEGGAG